MTRKELIGNIRKKKSFLCIGLDSDLNKIPHFLMEENDPVFEFNKQIIDATHDLAIAYKPNMAFYESGGIAGWKSLQKTIDYLQNFEDVFIIADAKRGDIGNTSRHYARAFFEHFKADALTVAPYMGKDSIEPFLEFENKWVILLALTSNQGAFDFQYIQNRESGKKVFEEIIETSKQWAGPDKMMYVVGATKAEMLSRIRKIAPEHFLLVPGIGAQGGSLEEVAKHGMNKDCGLIVNSSRGIIFASKDHDFAEQAREKASELQQKMEKLLM
ncbi:MAG: orotidine-5'-phosphate decarboxylase [Bacteroidales bacterium]|nr:orotidine-5'-phosphate decarboxylase [Bacteroidales bacterium]MCF8388986.1 orotidine-5'-phosphate decarboxylase [Bacteroidales bacterium]MCF8398641.1 orotidine-5'-phosphate decarboxylase [Bacteroidales bacterium]